MYQNIFITSRTDEQPSTVYLWDDEKGLITHPYADFDYAYRRDSNGSYTSIYGHKLKKVHYWNKDSDDVFESDVPRETRVLTDLYVDSDELSKNHVVGFIDIEVGSIGGFANIETADKPILSIAVYNQKTNLYIVFVLDENHRLADKEENGIYILRYNNEEDLLQAFMNWYSEQQFTILTGWNVSGFDIPYLYRRIRNILGEDTANMLSPIGMLKWSTMRERYQIAGVATLDYLEMYRKFTFTPRPSYRLDAIGLVEVNLGKVDLGMTIDDIYENDVDKFIEYNVTDVKIVVELDNKLKLIDLVRSICHVGHVQYEDYMYSSKFIEGTILVYLHRKGIVSPNKPIDGQEQMQKKDEADEEGFTGAFVKEPVPGLYHWVYSLDLQSLYPSIIMTLNISPETKVGRVHNWNVESHLKHEIELYELTVQDEELKLTREKFEEFMEQMKFSLSSNGILYVTDRMGIIPEILDKWFSQRVEFRELMRKNIKEGNKELANYYDKRQHVQKIFLNSIYGVLGLPIFRFYDLDNALAVTATGQDVIKTSAKYINQKYKEATEVKKDYCIYIDTDSLYFSSVDYAAGLPDVIVNPLEYTVELARAMEKMLNSFYSTMGEKLFFVRKNNRLVIRGESIADTAFWVVKKRYALHKVYDLETNQDTDKITIKGLDVVRSSFPPAFAEFMTDVLKSILKSKTKEDVDGMIHEFHSNLSKVPFIKLARNTTANGLEKYGEKDSKSVLKFRKGTPLHVKAAIAYNRYMMTKNLHKKYSLIKDGEKIKYVYLTSNPLQIEAIAFKGFDDPPEVIRLITEHLDYEKLFEAELKGKLEDFYTAMSWGKIPTEVNQLAEDFFTF